MAAPLPRFEQVAGFILVGGASSRMERDKALLPIGGLPLVLRAATLLKPLVASTTIVGPVERYGSPGLKVIPDERPGLGPLGGIATALNFSNCMWNLVLACDMPFLSASWLDYLIARAVASPSDAVLPETARGPEPLCAVYHKRCSSVIAAAVARGVRKVTDGLVELAVEKITEAEWKKFDSDGRLFKNINTREDYDQARATLEEEASR